ncbi:MAG: hypothetical protein ACE5OS_12310 [Anaerolineae bacterium]
MSERHYGEKYEKEEEKEEEKAEKEHEKEEKTWDEKWRRDPLSAVVWAAILIWAGVALLAGNMGLLANVAWLDVWGLVFVGAGLIVLLEVAIRVLVPAYRRAVGGTLVLAAILLGIGLGNLFGWEVIGPLVLIAIGLGVLLRGFLRSR